MTTSDNLFIYGKNPVEEALKTRPDEIDKIYVKNSLRNSTFNEILQLSNDNGVPLVRVPGQKLYNLVGKVNDQGFVAQMSAAKYTDFYDWAETLILSENPAVLLLNGIEDPHNFGAILRSAAAAGISAVIIPMQNQAPVNATVFKTSAGTAGRIPVIRVHDTNQAFKDLQLTGFSIVGLDGNADQTLWEADFDRPVAFLIGNEGKGIRKSELKRCDATVSIPMEHKVESLNASVSAALVSYEWKRRKMG
ncbi:23S rRNA (guanosine(2251)-2'-O)-methyltransferase RlmB [Gracilimonas mengyeensis]|uniref:23S rRNA (Guanosine2251-2'-O)-methyltransferase n=1 Tax=Gracilimonas mengyeensis TaxID=1302730 RepID=A0A521F5E0_9BACT|nr:23S rRNA (guanosine(2251)-2'-O)-methyltransferase RlmB [Gracilimonas mengyeensis]SMO91385.1 23S rRNA (guanosine2251-2'-O)-methyltransferase [Gracilimonas mengyeensis]